MEISFFEHEMKRLKEQWPNAYSKERMIIFFNAFRDVSNFDFRDAITDCLATSRSAPLLPELTVAIEKARINYFQKKRIEESGMNKGLFGIENNGSADPEYVKKCIEHVYNLLDKKITKEQFDQGCEMLDQASKLFPNKTPMSPPINKPTNKPYKDDDDEKPF